jgi:hypothetical protein
MLSLFKPVLPGRGWGEGTSLPPEGGMRKAACTQFINEFINVFYIHFFCCII